MARTSIIKFLNTMSGITALILLQGCSTPFPENGTGGVAENYLTEDFSPTMPDEPLGPEHGLRFDWQLAKLHLQSLIQEGAKWCFPAAVVQALENQNRIARELAGGLQLDAANDLVIQRKRLNELEKQLNYVTIHTKCVPPTFENEINFKQHIATVEQLYKMLNVDNQFAINSIEINPKYMRHLAEAASQLSILPKLTLSITGHADTSGTPEQNVTLAQGRAEQVKRYLTILGVAPTRIKTTSVGDTLPLVPGNSDAVKLTNRRVSIEIIESTDEAKGGQNE
jgi:outer membrane protein OmpA-like peptidoglycan-associated protein